MLHWSLEVLLQLQHSATRAKCRICFSQPSQVTNQVHTTYVTILTASKISACKLLILLGMHIYMFQVHLKCMVFNFSLYPVVNSSSG